MQCMMCAGFIRSQPIFITYFFFLFNHESRLQRMFSLCNRDKRLQRIKLHDIFPWKRHFYSISLKSLLFFWGGALGNSMKFTFLQVSVTGAKQKIFCADTRNSTKKSKKMQLKNLTLNIYIIMGHVSHVMCCMSRVTCH